MIGVNMQALKLQGDWIFFNTHHRGHNMYKNNGRERLLEKKGNRGVRFFVKFLFCFTYKKIDKLCSNIFHSKLNRRKRFTTNAVHPLQYTAFTGPGPWG